MASSHDTPTGCAAGHRTTPGWRRSPPQSLKGWYNLAGGGAGFLLVETDDPRELTAMLQPFMDVVSFDVHAVYAVDYDQRIQELQQMI
jgi:hypothetical protein